MAKKTKYDKMQEKIDELEFIVGHLSQKVQKIERNLNIEIREKEEVNKEIKRKYGFSLTQKNTSTKGKKYLKWYATKRINGKQCWVYVGNNLAKAEEKINTWLAKRTER